MPSRGNLAAPNAQAVSAATPMPQAPAPSDMPPIPPELLMALMGGGQPQPKAPAPMPEPQGGDPSAILAQLGLLPQGGMEQMAAPPPPPPPDLGPSPLTAMEIGAPPMPDAPNLPTARGFAVDFRQQFYQRNGRFPSAADFSDDAFERDFIIRTGRPPSKAEWLARAMPPAEPMGYSEFAG